MPFRWIEDAVPRGVRDDVFVGLAAAKGTDFVTTAFVKRGLLNMAVHGGATLITLLLAGRMRSVDARRRAFFYAVGEIYNIFTPENLVAAVSDAMSIAAEARNTGLGNAIAGWIRSSIRRLGEAEEAPMEGGFSEALPPPPPPQGEAMATANVDVGEAVSEEVAAEEGGREIPVTAPAEYG